MKQLQTSAVKGLWSFGPACCAPAARAGYVSFRAPRAFPRRKNAIKEIQNTSKHCYTPDYGCLKHFCRQRSAICGQNRSKKWSFWVEKVTFWGQKLMINVQNRPKDLLNIMINHFLDRRSHFKCVWWCLASFNCHLFNIYGRKWSKNEVFWAKNDTFWWSKVV